MPEIMIVLASGVVAVASFAAGFGAHWLVARGRARTDVTASLCHLLNRTVNAALVRQDEQLTRVLNEERTNAAIAEAHESSPAPARGRFPMSPAYSAPQSRKEVSVGPMH